MDKKTFDNLSLSNACSQLMNEGVNEITDYETLKGFAKEAIDWQLDFDNHNYSWGDMVYFSEHFTKLGKRYGLLREFKENGILWAIYMRQLN